MSENQAAATVDGVAPEEAKKILSRQELRAQLLNKAPKPETRPLTLFGVDIELRQPTIEAIMEAKEEASPAQRAADMIIKFAYVPGTDEKVFDEADRDLILRWPFGRDVQKLNEVISELTGIDIDAAEQELKTDPLGGR